MRAVTPAKKISLPAILVFTAALTLLSLKIWQVVHAPAQTLSPPESSARILQSDPTAPTEQDVIRITAQVNPNPNSVTANAAPVYARCDQERAEPEEELEKCASASLNLTDYIVPSCGGPGSRCPNVVSSSVPADGTGPYIGAVNNYVEVLENGYIKQHSNEISFLFRTDGSYIRYLQDTIWGGGPKNGQFVCDGTDEYAFYRVYSNNPGEQGTYGSATFPVTAECGKDNSYSAYIKAYRKTWENGARNINDPSSTLLPESALSSCNVTGQSDIPVGNANRMIFNGSAVCNGAPFEMVAMLQSGGAGQGEVSMYCKGVGLCAWYQILDFSKDINKPKNWTATTDLCALTRAGDGSSLSSGYFEYNLQRTCGATPEKVLNNFLDEYSVTCMPQAEYVLDLVNADQCFRTPQGCNNWNTTGELILSGGSQLFGLFRSEADVNARGGSRAEKKRNESIEAYFTAHPSKADIARLNTDTVGLSTYQGALFKLTDQTQQCSIIYNKLEAVHELCQPENLIEGVSADECAINQTVTGSTVTYDQLYQQMRARGGKDACFQMMNRASTPTEQTLRERILSVDPAMELGYRPAFVVVATLVGDEEQLNPTFRATPSNSEKFWQVDYMEVKVPTFGSDFRSRTGLDRGYNPDRAGGSYKDPMRLTADLLMPLELQKRYEAEEQLDRTAVGETAQAGKSWTVTGDESATFGEIPPGAAIGGADAPIRCRSADSNNRNANFSAANCDNIARALITFINARAAVQPNQDGLHYQYVPSTNWVPSPTNVCEVDEKNFYGNVTTLDRPLPVDERTAEEAEDVGSSLGTTNSVGRYANKKTDATVNVALRANLRSGQDNAPSVDIDNIPGRTRIFYVSPHHYTLLYTQNAFLGLLTLEQQQKVLEDPNFTNVLKSGPIDALTATAQTATYSSGTAADGTKQTGAVIVTTGRTKDEGEVNRSPILWQAAGSVAGYATRLMALVTTPLGSAMHNYTLGCTGPNATEKWLKGECESTTNSGSATEDVESPAQGLQCLPTTMSRAEASAAAAALRATLPNQQAASTAFAGWARYFSHENDPQNQHLFQRSCDGGSLCYEFILNKILTTQLPNGEVINPYLAIGIALNETGGLYSALPDRSGRHFGCGVSGGRPDADGTVSVISSGTIESKLACMIGFFQDNASLTADEQLKLYGYSNGWRNRNLNQIIDYLTNNQYQRPCQ